MPANTWTTRAITNEARSNGRGEFTTGGKFLRIGGGDMYGYPVQEVRAWTAALEWAAGSGIAQLGASRWLFASGTIDGFTYISGGSSVSTSTEAYDHVGNVWTSKAANPVARRWPGGAAVGGKFYTIGGSTNTGDSAFTDSVRAYDPAANSWSAALAALPTARGGVECCAVNGKIVATGGYSGSYRDLAHRYNPDTDNWTALSVMPVVRGGHAIGGDSLNDDYYVLTGYSGSVVTRVDKFDLDGNVWTSKAVYPTSPGVSWPFYATYDRAVYVCGGTSTGEVTGNKKYFASYQIDDAPVSVATSISLEPSEATRTIGDEIELVAQVLDQYGAGMAGVSVTFTVVGPHAAEGPEVVVTDGLGQAEFIYEGSATGVDTVSAAF